MTGEARPPGALLPDTTVLFGVTVTWLRRPAPVALGAVLRMISLLLLITLLLRVIELPGPPPLPLPLAMPPPPGPVL